MRRVGLVLIMLGVLCGFTKPTLEEFREEILMHTERVRDYGLELYEGQKKYFRFLNLLPREAAWGLIDRYLKEHDRVKSMSVEELQAHGYDHDVTFASRLYKHYGSNIRPPFVDEMNFLEWRLKAKVLDRLLRNVSPNYAQGLRMELLVIEDVADVFDVKKNRKEELGIEPQPYDTAKFFERSGKPLQAALARSMEEERNTWEAYFHTKVAEPRLCRQIL